MGFKNSLLVVSEFIILGSYGNNFLTFDFKWNLFKELEELNFMNKELKIPKNKLIKPKGAVFRVKPRK